MSKFDVFVSMMADTARDWDDLTTDERLDVFQAHMTDVADEYSSEAISPEEIRALAKSVVDLDQAFIGRMVMTKWLAYAKRCTDSAVQDAMGIPSSLRRQA